MKSVALLLAMTQVVLATTWLVRHLPDAPDRRLPPDPVAATWTPPAWFPSPESLDVLPALDGPARHTDGPRLRARAAIVADLDTGEVLFARDPDSARSIASLTKLVSSLALASVAPDLDTTLCVTPEIWPSRPGALSRFETGTCHTGWELVGAALVASDNRGAMAMAPLAGLPASVFVSRMFEVSRELGLRDANWVEPSGLEDENLASARDVLKAITAVAAHPTLALMASAPTWTIERDGRPRELGSTNHLVSRFQTLAAKTGYTDTAHYGFATVVLSPAGRHLGVVVLGAPTSESRFADATHLLEWADDLADATTR